MRKLALVGALTLLASGVAGLAQDIVNAPVDAWVIGPMIRGKNYSVGMPPYPTPARRGWSFDFPYPNAGAGHVHYVTTNFGSLAGKSRIVMRYRIDAARGVQFVPQEYPQFPGMVSLYFQRRGDSWSGKRHPYHRWYAPRHTVRNLAPGEYEVTARLNDPEWVSIWAPATSNPQAFQNALAEADRVGFVFGSDGGRGHGVYATSQARFYLISFRVL